MADVKITVNPNGPYRVQGNVDLVDKARRRRCRVAPPRRPAPEGEALLERYA
jgi:hypothetical protein